MSFGRDRWTEQRYREEAARRQRWKTGTTPQLDGINGQFVDTDHCAGEGSAQGNAAAVPPTERGPTVGAPVTFVLPWPPSVNELYGTGRNGQKYLVDEQREFRNHVAWLVIQRRQQLRLAGRLNVLVTMYATDKRRFDVDNRLKALLDAFTHAQVWLDDSQIDELTIMRATGNERVCLVTVEQVSP